MDFPKHLYYFAYGFSSNSSSRELVLNKKRKLNEINQVLDFSKFSFSLKEVPERSDSLNKVRVLDVSNGAVKYDHVFLQLFGKSLFRHLKHLICENCGDMGDIICEAIHDTPLEETLTSISLQNTLTSDKGLKFLGFFDNVTHVNLNNTKLITDHGLSLLDPVPELRFLSFANNSLVRGFFTSFETGTETLYPFTILDLEDLSVAGCQRLSCVALQHILVSTQNALTTLNVSHCQCINSNSLETILDVKTLKNLYLEGCMNIKNKDLKLFLNATAVIEVLNISSLSFWILITDIHEIIQKMKKLKQFYIRRDFEAYVNQPKLLRKVSLSFIEKSNLLVLDLSIKMTNEKQLKSWMMNLSQHRLDDISKFRKRSQLLLSSISKKIPIEELSFSGMFLSENKLEESFQCVSLEKTIYLRILDCNKISFTLLNRMTITFDCIKTLDLSLSKPCINFMEHFNQKDFLDASTVQMILERFRGLARLNLSGRVHVNDSCFLGNPNHYLKELLLYRCKQVTHQGIQRLLKWNSFLIVEHDDFKVGLIGQDDTSLLNEKIRRDDSAARIIQKNFVRFNEKTSSSFEYILWRRRNRVVKAQRRLTNWMKIILVSKEILRQAAIMKLKTSSARKILRLFNILRNQRKLKIYRARWAACKTIQKFSQHLKFRKSQVHSAAKLTLKILKTRKIFQESLLASIKEKIILFCSRKTSVSVIQAKIELPVGQSRKKKLYQSAKFKNLMLPELLSATSVFQNAPVDETLKEKMSSSWLILSRFGSFIRLQPTLLKVAFKKCMEKSNPFALESISCNVKQLNASFSFDRKQSQFLKARRKLHTAFLKVEMVSEMQFQRMLDINNMLLSDIDSGIEEFRLLGLSMKRKKRLQMQLFIKQTFLAVHIKMLMSGILRANRLCKSCHWCRYRFPIIDNTQALKYLRQSEVKAYIQHREQRIENDIKCMNAWFEKFHLELQLEKHTFLKLGRRKARQIVKLMRIVFDELQRILLIKGRRERPDPFNFENNYSTQEKIFLGDTTTNYFPEKNKPNISFPDLEEQLVRLRERSQEHFNNFNFMACAETLMKLLSFVISERETSENIILNSLETKIKKRGNKRFFRKLTMKKTKKFDQNIDVGDSNETNLQIILQTSCINPSKFSKLLIIIVKSSAFEINNETFINNLSLIFEMNHIMLTKLFAFFVDERFTLDAGFDIMKFLIFSFRFLRLRKSDYLRVIFTFMYESQQGDDIASILSNFSKSMNLSTQYVLRDITDFLNQPLKKNCVLDFKLFAQIDRMFPKFLFDFFNFQFVLQEKLLGRKFWSSLA